MFIVYTETRAVSAVTGRTWARGAARRSAVSLKSASCGVLAWRGVAAGSRVCCLVTYHMSHMTNSESGDCAPTRAPGRHQHQARCELLV